MQALRILHLEDDPFFAEMVETLLKAKGLAVAMRRAESWDEFEAGLRGQTYDLIVSDHEIPGGDGLKALGLCRRECPETPFIFLSGRLGEELAIASLQNGAADYVLKSNISRFIPTVMRTLASYREAAALRAAEARIRRDSANLHGLIENTLDAIWSMDLECNVLVFNSAASLLSMKFTGHPMVEGTCFLDRLSPALQARWRDAVRRVAAQERFQEGLELEWNGRSTALEIGFNPIITGRKVTGVAVFAKDATDRKRVETAAARLEIQRRRLATSYRKMRVPLHGLERMAAILRRTPLDEGQSRYLGMLEASVRRLADLHERADEAGEGASRPEDMHRAEGNPGSARGPAAQGGDARLLGIERRAGAANLRILIVEDNPVNQLVAAGYLEKLGHQADVAGDGRQAVEACGRVPYDFILMDLEMPVMDGLTATAGIRALEASSGRRAWITALTAYQAPGIRERCLAAGMDAYLAKPLLPEALEPELAAALRNRANRAAARA